MITFATCAFAACCVDNPLQAQSIDPGQALPGSTFLRLDVASSSDWIDHPLRKRIESSEAFLQVWRSPNVVDMRSGALMFELALGQKLEVILKKLTVGGLTLALDAETEGGVLLARSESKEWLEKYLDKLINLVREDAKKKQQPDPIKQAEYKGFAAYEFQKSIWVVVGETLLITNKSDLGKKIVDRHLDGASDGLASKPSFRDAREARKNQKEIAWAYLDLQTVRDKGMAKDLFRSKSDNFFAELLLGGILATLQNAPYLSGTLQAEPTQLDLEFSSPHNVAWSQSKRDYFFGTEGTGEAFPLIRLNESVGSMSVYRDISQMWLMAGDLFDQKVNDQLAQADNTLTTLFSGKDFGEDILGSMEPQLRIVVSRQSINEGDPVPAIRLPAFALVAKLRDPKGMKPELKRIFQSFIGFLNVTGAQEGNPQLDLDMESSDGVQLVMARYVVEADRKKEKGVPIQFNFSPCLAFVGEQVIVSSTVELAKQIAGTKALAVSGESTASTEPVQARTNTLLELDANAIRSLLEDNRSHLISQNMLEKGHSKKEAETEINLLFRILQFVRSGRLDLRYGSDAKLTLSLQAAE